MRTHSTAVLAALAAALLGLTACSGTESTADARITVQSNWTTSQPQNAPFVAAIERFTEETGIEVDLVVNGDDLNQVFESDVLAGQEADVVLVNLTDKQLDWAKDGVVIPLNDQLVEWGLDEIVPTYNVEEWTDEEGNLRGIPYSGFTWPWWYNKAVFDSVGLEVPTTIEDLIAAAPVLREAGVAPMVIGGNDWSGQKIFLQVIQSYLAPERTIEVLGEGTYCDPDVLEGIELFVRLRDAGVFVDGVEGYTVDQATSLYFAGQAAIGSMGSWSYLDAPDDIVENTVLGGMPVVAGGQFEAPTAFQGATGSGWWVSNNGAEKLDIVGQFIQFMYSDEILVALLEEGGNVPLALPESADITASNPLLAEALTELPEAVDWAVMPDLYIPASATNPMYRSVSIAFTSGNDAQQVCAAMEEAYGQ